MSQENVELSRRAVDAFNRRDLDAFLALMDPDAPHSYVRVTPAVGSAETKVGKGCQTGLMP